MEIVPREKEIGSIKYHLYRIFPGMSTTEKIEVIIKMELHYYQLTKDKEYLLMAVDHIEAYMRLGYGYGRLQDLFDEVLEKLDTKREEVFLQRDTKYEVIKVNKSQINRILGRWYPVSDGMRKGEAIEDILKHILGNEIGTYNYYCRGSNFELIITTNDKRACRNDGRGETYYKFKTKEH